MTYNRGDRIGATSRESLEIRTVEYRACNDGSRCACPSPSPIRPTDKARLGSQFVIFIPPKKSSPASQNIPYVLAVSRECVRFGGVGLVFRPLLSSMTLRRRRL